MFQNTMRLVALLVLLSGGATAQSLHTAPRGTKVTANFELGAVTIPLPAGDWTLAGRGEIQGREATGVIRIASVYLVEHASDKIERIIYAEAPLRGQGSGTGWVRNRFICDRTNVFHNESDRNFNPREIRCWQVNHFVVSAPNNPSEPLRDFYSWMEENRLALPKIRVVTEHQVTATGPYIVASYAFNPETIGIEAGPSERWDSTDWSVSQIVTHPDKKAFSDRMKVFGTALQADLVLGLQSRLDKTRFSAAQLERWPVRAPIPIAAPPGVAPAAPAGGSVAERLRILDDLRSRGLVTDSEYQAQRQRILENL